MTSIKTPTCFGTGMPSSGSVLEQRTASPTRWCNA